jgi:hypothetical protein
MTSLTVDALAKLGGVLSRRGCSADKNLTEDSHHGVCEIKEETPARRAPSVRGSGPDLIARGWCFGGTRWTSVKFA